MERRYLKQLAIFGCASTVVGAVCGIGITSVQSDSLYTNPFWLFLGFAHAIVYVPFGIFMNVRALDIIISMVICFAFPFWAFVGYFCGVGVGAALVCTSFWGCVVFACTRDLMGLLEFVGIGVFLTIIASIYVSYGCTSYFNQDAWICRVLGIMHIPAWHALAPIVLYRIAKRRVIEVENSEKLARSTIPNVRN